MNELIEKLKDKNYVRAFGLMTPKEQECFRKVGIPNCELFCQDLHWDKLNSTDCDFGTLYTYAIKPDYQPEPEFVDLEIIRSGSWLGCVCTKPEGFYSLERLPSLPNFEGFKVIGNSELAILTEHVAMHCNAKDKVIARFRK